MDQRLIDELKAKHPGEELHRLGGTKEPVVVKSPGAALWDTMQDKVADPKSTPAQRRAAAHNLLISCVVYPDRQVVSDLLEKRPGLLQTFTGQLAVIAGVDNEAVSEKL